jgi:maltodextrin utilization protein YvdJ
VSELEPQPPPVGEEIHLPAPTVVPALTALGITLTLVGLTTFIELTVIGGLLTLACVVSWIKTARAETDELPLD